MNFEAVPCHSDGLTLPAGFVQRMQRLMHEDFLPFCASYAKPPHPSLRINSLKITREEATALLPFLGPPVPWQENGYYYPSTEELRPGKHPFHEAGAYYIQEASAMLPASLCPPCPGERVLDLCAAPGGKATQLAASLRSEGVLVANEIHPQRASILSQNMERMGVRNCIVTNSTPEELAVRFPSFFDLIVVDAPCSGEGMFRKEADAVSMWSLENVSLCATRQGEILEKAAETLRVGGHLVYSTCTFAPAENEGVILEFLSRHPEFEVISSPSPAVESSLSRGLLDAGRPEWVEGYSKYPSELRESVKRTYRIFPHHCDGEGHYAALLLKRESKSSLSPGAIEKKGRPSEKPLKAKGKSLSPKEAMELFRGFCQEVMGRLPDWIEKGYPCLFGEKLYLIPRALCKEEELSSLFYGLRVLRAGLCVGSLLYSDRGRPRFEPDHALALCAENGCRSFEVDYGAAVAYLKGETLPCDLNGWYTVSYEGLSMGWGKASGGVMKNHLPKGIRRS